MNKIYKSSKEHLENGNDLMLVKIIKSQGSTPRSQGAIMAVNNKGESWGTIGGGSLEKYCIQLAVEKFGNTFKEDIALGSKKKSPVAMVCGGDVSVEFRFFNKESLGELDKYFSADALCQRVIIFGAGHVASQCVRVLNYLEFDVVVYDSRSDFANTQHHPLANKIICAPFDRIDENIKILPDDYVAVMTHGHINDAAVLLQVLKHKCKYIGCIGSKNKIKVVYEFLLQNGISKSDIERVHSPIGLEIYAQTPEEIAISIAAEIISIKNKT